MNRRATLPLLLALLLSPPAAGAAGTSGPAAAEPAPHAKSGEDRAAALLAEAGEEIQGGHAAQAQQTLAKALSLFHQLDDKRDEATCVFLEGLADNAAGDAGAAEAHYEASLPLLEGQGENFIAWMTILLLAMNDEGEGKPAAALDRYEHALALLNDVTVTSRRFTLQDFVLLGKALHLPSFAGFDPSARRLRQPILLRFAEGVTRDRYAAILVGAGRLAEAEAQLAKAGEISSSLAGILDPSIQLHLGDLRRSQWRFDEAKESYERALAGLGRLPHLGPLTGTGQRIQILDKLAEIDLLRGRTDEALAWNDKALDQTRHDSAAGPKAAAMVLESRADILLRAGRTDDAEATLNQGLAIANQLDDRRRQASILAGLASVAGLRGSYENAAALAEKALSLIRQLHEPILEARIASLLYQIYATAGAPASSAALLEETLASARKSGSRFTTALTEVVAAARGLWAGKADTREFREKLQALRALPEAGDPRFAGLLELLDKNHGPPDSASATSPSHTDPAAGTPADRWLSQSSLGERYRARGDLPAARKAWMEALEACRTLGNKILTAFASGKLGEIYLLEGRIDKAVESFSQAVASVEDGAAEVKGDEFLTAYLGNGRWLYDYLVELLLFQGNAHAAFEYTERARGRALLQLLGNRRLRLRRGAEGGLTAEVDALRLAIADWERQLALPASPRRDQLVEDLRQARARYQALLVRVKLLDPDYASLVAVEPLKVETVQRELTPGTTLVSYFVTFYWVHAWVVDEDRCEHVALPVDREDLRSAVCFAGTVGRDPRGAERAGECAPAKILAERFYGKLIAPLLPHLRHRRLVIVPHAELHYVPFAALRDAQTGRYLVQDFTLAYAPSASALRLMRAKEHPVAGRAMVLGAPTGIDAKLGPLPAAAAEAAAVARLFGTTPLLGAAARESRLFDLAGKVDLLHIAAHAVYEPAAPLFSRIVLAPDEQRNGNLEVHEIFSDLDLSGVSLVVLSACQTALGERSGGDEIVGLTRAFLHAGTPAVVSTLWSVNDQASAVLMEEFYRRLLGGAPAAEALRQAQRALLDSSKYRDPFFWAGFTLTGDPQQSWAPERRNAP